jgi:uncharacterized protein YfiM (DUF2279 family)
MKYLALSCLFVALITATANSQTASTLVEDKSLHLGLGSLISVAVGYSAQQPSLGLISGIVAGVGKKVWDNYHENESLSWKVTDVAITSAGAALGYWLVKKMIASERRPAIVRARERSPHKSGAAVVAATTPLSASVAASGGD